MEITEALIRLAVATALGGLLGLEREATGKQAGLRTHALVGLGSALFTILSISGFQGGETSRVAAQIVSGVGFLGAGAIFRSGPLVKGLTTAAGLWAAAAVGMAAGADQTALAVIATVMAAVILIALRSFDALVERVRQGSTLVATVTPAHGYLAVRDQLESIDPGVELTGVNPQGDSATVSFLVQPKKAEFLCGALAAMEQVTSARVDAT